MEEKMLFLMLKIINLIVIIDIKNVNEQQQMMRNKINMPSIIELTKND